MADGHLLVFTYPKLSGRRIGKTTQGYVIKQEIKRQDYECEDLHPDAAVTEGIEGT